MREGARERAPVGFAGALAGALLRCKMGARFESKARDARPFAIAGKRAVEAGDSIMAYRIEGLAPEAFESLFGMMDGELAAQRRGAGHRRRAGLSLPGQPRGGRAGRGADPAQPCLARRRRAVPHRLRHLRPQGRRGRPLRRRGAAYARHAHARPARLRRRRHAARTRCSPCRAKPTRRSARCSSGPKSPPSTRTTPPMAASWRESRGIDHGQPCNRHAPR